MDWSELNHSVIRKNANVLWKKIGKNWCSFREKDAGMANPGANWSVRRLCAENLIFLFQDEFGLWSVLHDGFLCGASIVCDGKGWVLDGDGW